MAKIIPEQIIDQCYDCKYAYGNKNSMWCSHVLRIIRNKCGIPNWCTLDNAPIPDNKNGGTE